jgi:putative addiction module CopG family antidote
LAGAASSSRMRANLSGGLVSPHNPAVEDITLRPDLERFVTEEIAAGRYRDRAALVAAAISLLRRQEQARAELLASVLAAKEDADRDGYLSGDEVMERVRATIARRANAAAIIPAQRTAT